MAPQPWRSATQDALYGPDGFFRRTGTRPAAHFRTSAHTGYAFATAISRLLTELDTTLGRPDRLDIVDIGGGRGELLAAILSIAPRSLADRLRPTVVEIADRPASLDSRIGWLDTPPKGVTGLLIATEWLDNIPVDVVTDRRYVLVDEWGSETIGGIASDSDLAWLDRWWPSGHDDPTDARAEIGAPRDDAWADAVARLDRGVALTVDYGHLRGARPTFGTLTSFRDGREIRAVPDGSADLTAHVAIDAVAAAGAAVAGEEPSLVRQADALRALGISGRRPPISLAHSDPIGYLRALGGASVAGELTASGGLGDHFWLWQTVGVDLPPPTMAG